MEIKIRDISARLENLNWKPLFVMGIVLNCVIGLLDYALGKHAGAEIFYLLPIFFVSWFVGRKAGILMSVVSVGTLVLADVVAVRQHDTIAIWNLIAHFGVFLIFTYLLSGIKRAFDEISEGKTVLSSILESAGEGIYGIDTKGNHTMVNRTAVQMLGYEVHEIIGEHSHPIWHYGRADGTPYPEEQCLIYATLRDGIVKHITNEVFWKKDGTPFPVDYTVAPIWEKGRITGAVIIFRDITQNRRAEEDLEQAMKDLARSNKDLEQFAYIISHDLQAPLRSISGFINILAEDYRGKLDGNADKYIDFIVSGAKRMQKMIDHILKYSRVGSHPPEIQPCNFEAVLMHAVENLFAMIEEKGAVITHDPLPTVRADLAQMILLVQNLLSNALKFSAGRPRVHVSAAEKENEWVFSVRDNGIGIDPDQSPRLFTLFQRLHTEEEYPGNGVGLATCKKIVDRHCGRIWVESEVGKGAIFSFSLPAEGSPVPG